MVEINLTGASNSDRIKIYRYRWIVLLIFCLFTIVNFMQMLQFTIIANIITEYYDVAGFAVDVSGLIFFILYVLLFLPVSYLIEKYSLWITAVVSSGLTFLGCLVKLLCADPNRFYVVIIGQAFCALGQVYMLSIPSKFAATWFGPDEVSTACAIAVLGTQLGVALGSVFPPLIIKKDDDNVGENLSHMMIYNASVSAVVFIIVIVFFRGRPKLPPSQSQLQLIEDNDQPKFLDNARKLIRNKDFLVILLSFGLFTGLWNSFGIMINTLYIHYFPNGESDVGIIVLLATISGGCIGSVVFGLALDKTHKFKQITIGVMVTSSVMYIFVAFSLIYQCRIAAFFTITIFGFFAASVMAISFEYTIEVTYPIPESVSCSVLNATVFLFSIICTLLIEGLISTIGYLYSFGIGLIAFIICDCVVCFVSSNLHRRNANIAEKIPGELSQEESQHVGSDNTSMIQ
ncbi:hypothetical protein NQ318_009422 [Aromia moschata]|uniref:Major facilitator superfamily (MFS) profile domain-containing protein n=1 Tax=Aromia moschata TaxID=1265417 RepID=A0AAV8Z7C9_9CUCU|nr:hypothetical protein NQ318_009422 [Aromia moschata]